MGMASLIAATASLAALAGVCGLTFAAPADAAPFMPKKNKPFSDKFTQDSVLNPRWVLAEPNGGSSYSLGKHGLVLDASALNGGSDLWPVTNYNASLLLQPISASFDWTVKTRVMFQVTNNYMGAGLVLTQQTSGFTASSVFHRFEYGDNPQPGIESFTNGTPDPNYAAFDGKLVYLMLQKAGSIYTYSYSTNGKSWTPVSTITDSAAYSYIGLISIRQPYDGQTGVDAKPVFSYFDIKLAK
jgi:cytochrome c